MKRLSVLLFAMLVLTACATTPQPGHQGVTADVISSTPTTYCTVLKEPNPLLLGGWKCVHKRWVGREANYENDPVEFYLKKDGDKYALYFFRSKEEGNDKVFHAWRNFKIKGDEIDSETGVRFFVQGDQVFFSWNKEKPVPMTRIPLENKQ
jgi:hypothetical protein